MCIKINLGGILPHFARPCAAAVLRPQKQKVFLKNGDVFALWPRAFSKNEDASPPKKVVTSDLMHCDRLDARALSRLRMHKKKLKMNDEKNEKNR